jgi:hypothetical protein
MKVYTPEEITEAYEKLIWAQGLVDFVLHAGFDLSPEMKTDNEGALISIFSIIQDYLPKAVRVMEDLDMGSEEQFSALWKKAKRRMKNETEALFFNAGTRKGPGRKHKIYRL